MRLDRVDCGLADRAPSDLERAFQHREKLDWYPLIGATQLL